MPKKVKEEKKEELEEVVIDGDDDECYLDGYIFCGPDSYRKQVRFLPMRELIKERDRLVEQQRFLEKILFETPWTEEDELPAEAFEYQTVTNNLQVLSETMWYVTRLMEPEDYANKNV